MVRFHETRARQRAGFAFTALLMLLPIQACKRGTAADRAVAQRAVYAVKARYRPNEQLMERSPDLRNAVWDAKRSSLCDTKAADCWSVKLSTKVRAIDDTVDAQWLVDLKSLKVLPRNMAAQNLFDPVPERAARERPTVEMEPVPERVSHWTATSRTARAVTGDIESTPSKITMAGNVVPVTRMRKLEGDELANASKLFAAKVTPETQGALYQANLPSQVVLLPGKKLCGNQDTNWIVVMISRRNGLDASGSNYGQELELAAFSGQIAPDLSPSAIASAKTLCGTFEYRKTPTEQ
jgi:hypothetical protein